MGILRTVGKAVQLRLARSPSFYKTLRRLWQPPASISQHLWFNGPFELALGDNKPLILQAMGGEAETSLFWRGFGLGWEGRSLLVWQFLARRSNVIADVGANTGIYALVAQSANASAKVLALEPSPQMLRVLQLNVSRNNSNVIPIGVAASDHAGCAILYDTPEATQTGASLVAPPKPDSVVEVQVETRTLDQILHEKGFDNLDLAKIDVEMHEAACIRGMLNTIWRVKPTLLIEVLTDDLGAEIEQLLVGTGYVYVPIDENADRKRGRHEVSRNVLICQPNVLAELRADFPELKSASHVHRPR